MLWIMFCLRFRVRSVVFLAILAVARMVIWTMQKKELYDNAIFSHCDLILFLGISLGSRLDVIENAWTA